MEEFRKIITLKNEIEAKLLDEILKEKNIPHLMRSYYDLALDGLFQQQKGWGHIEAPESYRQKIESIYKDILSGQNDEESPPGA